MHRKSILLALSAGALALPAPAGAHVTVHPNKLPAGSFTVVDVRVPNEREDASTTKVDVQLPDGFIFVSTAPLNGWKAKLTREKLAKPVEVFGEQQTEQVSRVTWTADKDAALKPGEFQEFPMSISVPDKAGQPLTFKALQTYSNGEIVRWIGDPKAEQPAPQVAVAARDAVLEDIPAGATTAAAAEPATAAPAAPAAASDDEDGPSTGLVVAALVLGGLGLLAGLTALVTRRRTPAM